ncbi:hypothetical protein MTR67_050794 [Solanum verrucosum]|uniref:Gag-pol polyprotein n=1 Tax=Solanum verrucosum TaxID=315347 RepID=A0AAF1A269_SOLVR|nr:hypothetical protein MTR67_050794 [Solanum verrucosum]
MLSQAVINQVGQQRGVRHDVANTSRIREFLRMNPSSFTCSSDTEDPKNFVEELQKVFEIMHVTNAERVELAAYQLNGITRIWFDQWKKCMDDSSLIIPIEDIGIKDSLSYEEIPVQILDRQVCKLRTKEVASVKVL